ncbi:TPA: hypothetical protein R2I11_004202 [Bacillus cereus]|nr:hypothetical protein [Bacillus cereus]
MEEENKSWFSKKENWWIILGILTILIAIATPFGILYKLGWDINYRQFEKLGAVGDYFGGTTVGLFTLASIMFVIAAIVMQKKELELQRSELKLTRDEFKTGNDTAKIQQIDNAFFNMLTLHHQIVNDIEITRFNNTYTGRKAFVKLRNVLEEKLQVKQRKNGQFDGAGNLETSITQDILDEVYRDFHKDFENDIGHYMRNNYRIVKFIVNNVVENVAEQHKIQQETNRETIVGDRRYYFGMLRAQWSNAEFELILINSLYTENKKFKNLILKYDVLDIQETKDKKDDFTPVKDFKLKESMDRFKAYKDLIEVNK